jgi:hypothetical protein
MVNNRELARKFSEGATKGKGSHMFIEGNAIYSYGHHFPIAVRTDYGYIFNNDSYSSTTGKQKGFVRSALDKDVYLANTEQLKGITSQSDSVHVSKLPQNVAQEWSNAQFDRDKREVIASKERKSKNDKFQRQLKKGIAIEKSKNSELSDLNARSKAFDNLRNNLDYYKKESKTEKEFVVQGNYGQGYKDVTTESTSKDAKQRLGEYNENERQYAHRIVMRRIPSRRRASQRHSRSSTRTSSGAL